MYDGFSGISFSPTARTSHHMRHIHLAIPFRNDGAGLRLPPDPLKNQIDRLCLLRVRKRHPSLYAPPFLHAAAATTGRRMHRLECRMSAHRSLPAVICRNCRRKFFAHKICRVALDSFHPHPLNIHPIRSRQLEATAKLRSPQSLKCLIECHWRKILPKAGYFCT